MKYRADIDGLRALAVLPVIFFHAGFELFKGGFVGVDVFFVISGYLITNIIISEIEEGKFSIIRFYERRARRILPALFFVMLICLPFAWFWLTPSDLKDFGQSLVAVSTFSSNILFWFESGYFDNASEMKPLLHTWSLAVEEQYYILFPLFLILTWQLGIKLIVILLIVFFLISLSLAHLLVYDFPSASFYLLPTRGWELLIGVFVALYLKYNSKINSFAVNQFLSLLGGCLIIFSIIAFDDSTPFPSLYALIPTAGTALLILCSVPKTISHNILSAKPLVTIGLISYSAYLWHQPLFAFARHRIFDEISTFILLMLCVLSLVLAWMSWNFVEKPFRDRNKISSKAILIASLVTSLSFIGIGSLMHLKNGFPERVNSTVNVSTISSSPLRDDCHSKEIPCEYFGERLTWATFGDSHMVELSYALANSLKEKGLGIEHNTYTSCKPSLTDKSSNCYDWTLKTLDRLTKSNDIQNILVSYRLSFYLYGDHIESYPFFPNQNTEEERNILWKDLIEILSMLSKSGKKIYFVVQPPELPRHVEKLVFWNDLDKNTKIKGVSRSWWNKRNLFVSKRLKDLPNGINVIDVTEKFCDQEWCYINDSNGFLYFDDNHVSTYGASVIINEGQLR